MYCIMCNIKCTQICFLNWACLVLKIRNQYVWNARNVIKVDQLNLESQNQAKNISVGLPSSPSKFEANRSRGSWAMIGQTKKQKVRQLYIYIDTHSTCAYFIIRVLFLFLFKDFKITTKAKSKQFFKCCG